MHPFDQVLIAEVGSVHDGSFGNAMKLIEAAAASGAKCVKFQTHIAEAETIRNAPNPPYFKAEPRFEYFQRTAFTRSQYDDMMALCAERHVGFLSSPFSLEAIDFLEEVGVDAYKVPSGEVTNLPLLRHLAQTKKPVLLSSGMSDWAELDAAVEVLRGGGPLLVMQCSSAYPCSPEAVGLNVIAEMKGRYGCAVGFSDHTLGYASPIAAAALGAVCVEKHFTFSTLMYGSDAQHSMTPERFRVLADSLNEVWTALAHPVDKNDISAYAAMKTTFQKSLVARQALPRGTTLTADMVALKKPGTGIPPAQLDAYLGKTLARDVAADALLHPDDFFQRELSRT